MDVNAIIRTQNMHDISIPVVYLHHLLTLTSINNILAFNPFCKVLFQKMNLLLNYRTIKSLVSAKKGRYNHFMIFRQ